MNVKFTASEKRTGNKGSVSTLVEYLEKENQGKDILEAEMFFDQTHDKVSKYDVIENIDNNKRKLGAKDAKFYMLVISPSEKELDFLDNDLARLKKYTRALMKAYAENFKKGGLAADDILYYAKVEQHRYDKRHNKVKKGNNIHIHVIISRRDKQQRFKLSPMTNHINSSQGPIKGGFSRKAFYEASEEVFDKAFNYQRNLKDSWEYQYTMKHGTEEAISNLLQKIAKESPAKNITHEKQIKPRGIDYKF